MKQFKFILTLFVVTLCSIHASAQYVNKPDSLESTTEISLNLKLKYTPIQLDLNSAELTKNVRHLYVFNQQGMYEQYNVNQSDINRLQPYKAFYPSGMISIHSTERRRDSFNPHGSNTIGSALLNGIINGFILGNKY